MSTWLLKGFSYAVPTRTYSSLNEKYIDSTGSMHIAVALAGLLASCAFGQPIFPLGSSLCASRPSTNLLVVGVLDARTHLSPFRVDSYNVFRDYLAASLSFTNVSILDFTTKSEDDFILALNCQSIDIVIANPLQASCISSEFSIPAIASATVSIPAPSGGYSVTTPYTGGVIAVLTASVFTSVADIVGRSVALTSPSRLGGLPQLYHAYVADGVNVLHVASEVLIVGRDVLAVHELLNGRVDFAFVDPTTLTELQTLGIIGADDVRTIEGKWTPDGNLKVIEQLPEFAVIALEHTSYDLRKRVAIALFNAEPTDLQGTGLDGFNSPADYSKAFDMLNSLRLRDPLTGKCFFSDPPVAQALDALTCPKGFVKRSGSEVASNPLCGRPCPTGVATFQGPRGTDPVEYTKSYTCLCQLCTKVKKDLSNTSVALISISVALALLIVIGGLMTWRVRREARLRDLSWLIDVRDMRFLSTLNRSTFSTVFKAAWDGHGADVAVRVFTINKNQLKGAGDWSTVLLVVSVVCVNPWAFQTVRRRRVRDTHERLTNKTYAIMRSGTTTTTTESETTAAAAAPASTWSMDDSSASSVMITKPDRDTKFMALPGMFSGPPAVVGSAGSIEHLVGLIGEHTAAGRTGSNNGHVSGNGSVNGNGNGGRTERKSSPSVQDANSANDTFLVTEEGPIRVAPRNGQQAVALKALPRPASSGVLVGSFAPPNAVSAYQGGRADLTSSMGSEMSQSNSGPKSLSTKRRTSILAMIPLPEPGSARVSASLGVGEPDIEDGVERARSSAGVRGLLASRSGTVQGARQKEKEERKTVPVPESLLRGTWLSVRMNQLTALRHPRVVETYGAGVLTKQKAHGSRASGYTVHLVTEQLEGGTLAALLQNPTISLSLEMKLNLLIQAAEGLTYLHGRGFVHGGLTPSKLFLDERNQLKIGSFPFRMFEDIDKETAAASTLSLMRMKAAAAVSATVLSSTRASVTVDKSRAVLRWLEEQEISNRNGAGIQSSTTLRTNALLYAAPEVLRGAAPTPASDVYSFAIVMWTVLTRTSPYPSFMNRRTFLQTLDKGLRPPLDSRIPGVLFELLGECWLSHPMRRPSIGEVFRRLKSLLSHPIVQTLIAAEASEEHRATARKGKSSNFPRPIAEKLAQNEPVEPQHYSSVSVCFLDFGPTIQTLMKTVPVEQLNYALSTITDVLDTFVSDLNLFRIACPERSILLIAGGIHEPQADHAVRCCTFAVKVKKILAKKLVLPNQPHLSSWNYVGSIASGAAVTSVEGTSNPRFLLTGEAMTTATLLLRANACHNEILASTGTVAEVNACPVLAAIGGGGSITGMVGGNSDSSVSGGARNMNRSNSTSVGVRGASGPRIRFDSRGAIDTERGMMQAFAVLDQLGF